MRLTVEEVLGIVECGRSRLDAWHTFGVLSRQSDDAGDEVWDEWMLLAALVLHDLDPGHPDFTLGAWQNGPLDRRLRIDYATMSETLWVDDGGRIHSKASTAAIDVSDLMAYAREELEPVHGETPFR